MLRGKILWCHCNWQANLLRVQQRKFFHCPVTRGWQVDRPFSGSADGRMNNIVYSIFMGNRSWRPRFNPQSRSISFKALTPARVCLLDSFDGLKLTWWSNRYWLGCWRAYGEGRCNFLWLSCVRWLARERNGKLHWYLLADKNWKQR